MFAYTPAFFVRGSLRRIAEDAEEYGRLGRIRPRKILGVETKRDRDALHQRMRGFDRRAHVRFDRRTKLGHFARPQIGAVKRPARSHARVLAWEVDAEIQPLLAIGDAGGELAFERKPTTPRARTVLHRDCLLRLPRKREEAPTGGVETRNDVIGDAMAPDIEKAGVAASSLYTRGNGGASCGIVPAHERRDVNDGQNHGGELLLPGGSCEAPREASQNAARD